MIQTHAHENQIHRYAWAERAKEVIQNGIDCSLTTAAFHLALQRAPARVLADSLRILFALKAKTVIAELGQASAEEADDVVEKVP